MTAALPALPGYRSTTRTSTCRAPRHCLRAARPQGLRDRELRGVRSRARRRGCLCGDGEGRRRALLPRRHALHDELVHACEAVTALAHCVPEAFTAKRENHPVARMLPRVITNTQNEV